MKHDELPPMAQGYAVAMIESQEFWPDDFAVDFTKFKLAEVDHFLPGANRSIKADCERFVEMAIEELGDDFAIIENLTDGERHRLGSELWYRRLGRDTIYETSDETMTRAMNAAVQRLGRPIVLFCSIGYIQHSTRAEKST